MRKFFMKSSKNSKLMSIIVIILLILIIITILFLLQKNIIITKSKFLKERYSEQSHIDEAKQKLEEEIIKLRNEQEEKGEELKKEDLPKINSNEIDVRSIENFPVRIIYGKYRFNVDSNFVVEYVGEENGTIVTYTTEPEGYTNKDKVDVLIVINNENGIKTVEFPDGDILDCKGKLKVGIDYSVNKNGIYEFKIIDQNNVEIVKDVVIEKIDKLQPKDFTPTITEKKISSITVKANAEDENANEENVKSGIARYEYYIKEVADTVYTKYETTEKEYKINNLQSEIEYKLYVIAYDYAGNERVSNEIDVIIKSKVLEYPILTTEGFMNCIDEDGSYFFDKDVNTKSPHSLKVKAYDRDSETSETIGGWRQGCFNIEPDCWGKYIVIEATQGYVCLGTGESNNDIGNLFEGWLYGGKETKKCVVIPDGAYWGAWYSGGQAYTTQTYEIWCSDQDLSGN